MPTLKSVAPPWSAAIVQLPLTLCYSILQMPDSLTSTKTGENDIWLPHIHLSPQKSRGHHSPLILQILSVLKDPIYKTWKMASLAFVRHVISGYVFLI